MNHDLWASPTASVHLQHNILEAKAKTASQVNKQEDVYTLMLKNNTYLKM